MYTDVGRPSAGHDRAAHRQFPLSAALDGRLGCCTAWAPRTRSCPASSRSIRPGGTQNYGQRVSAGLVPGNADRRRRPQATARSQIANIENPKLTAELQRKQLDLLGALNREQLARGQGQSGAGRGDRIVRAGVPHGRGRAGGDGPFVRKRRRRSRPTASDEEGTDRFGRQCLLARRFAEAGRAVHRAGHGQLGPAQQSARRKLTTNAHAIDKPIAALLARPRSSAAC